MSIAQLTNSTAKLQGFSAILTRKSPKNRRLKLKRDCRPASVSPPYLHDYFMSFSVQLCAPFSNVLKSKQRFDITCSGLSYLRAYNERALFSRGSSLIYFISLFRRSMYLLLRFFGQEKYTCHPYSNHHDIYSACSHYLHDSLWCQTLLFRRLHYA